MTRDDSRSVILARRARFVAAALAGSGVGLGSMPARADESETGAEQPPEAPSPRVCLSDVLIEGTAQKPQEIAADPPPPRPCLSIVRPENRIYLRFGAGPALLGMSVHDEVLNESGSGFGPQLDLAVGLMLSERLAVAFGVTGFYAPSLRNDSLGSGTFWRLGTVIDYFFDRDLGFHGSLSFGPVYFGVERAGRDGAHGLGFGVGAWLGYDLALSRSAALGFAVGGMGGFGGGLGTESDTGLNARALSFLISVRLH